MKLPLSFLGFGAFLSVSGAGFTEDFTSPNPADYAGKELPAFVQSGGVNGSPCAVMSYNGQALLRVLPESVTARRCEFSVKAKLETSASFCRISFGADKLNWNTHQGFYDLRRTDDNWHTVKFVLTPNPVKGGEYTVYLDGKQVKQEKMQNGSTPVERIRIGYLSPKSDGKIYLDDVEFQYGDRLPLPPEEAVRIEFPSAAARRFTTDTVELKLNFSGETGSLQNYRAKVYPNNGNFHNQAEKEAIAEAPVTLADDGKTGVLTLEKLPYGFLTVRIFADAPDGKSHVVKEEFLSRMHPAPRPAAAHPIRWGIDSHADRVAAWEQELDALVSAGANWTRLEMNLDTVTNPREKTISFTHHDRVVKAMKERGINCFFLINVKPQWSGITPQSDRACFPDLENWELACRMIMERYRGDIKFYEICNEPQHYNWNHFEPGVINEEHYADMLQVARKVAAEISPDIKVMGPCLTPNMNEWLNGMARRNGFDGIEYLSYHDNSFPDYTGQFYLRRVKELTGRTLKPFVTESTNDLRRVVASFAGETPSAAFAYTMYDKGTGSTNYEDYNGMVKRDGLPKNRHIAYQFCATLLNHATYIGRIFSTEGVGGYLFKENGVYTAVVWADDSDKLPKLAFTPGVERFDMLGNPFEGDRLETVPPGTSITGPAPRFMAYLRNLPAESDEILAASVNCDSDYKLFETGSGQKLGLSFTNESGKPRTFKLSMKNGGGVTFGDPVTVTVAPGETVRRGIGLAAGPDAPAGEIRLDGVIETEGKTLPRRFGPVRVIAPERIREKMLWNNGRENPILLPGQAEDIHVEHSTGVQRDKQDQAAATRGASVELVKAAGIDHDVTRINYVFRRPAKGWLPSIWLASRYKFEKPLDCPGIPLKVTMRILMEDNLKNYPIVMMYTFEDPSGKEIRIEGSNLFFSDWRDNECFLPSFFTHGRLHSVSRGNKLRVIDAYPLKLTGFILNLVPLSSSVHAPKDLPAVKGYFLLDNLRLEYYQTE